MESIKLYRRGAGHNAEQWVLLVNLWENDGVALGRFAAQSQKS